MLFGGENFLVSTPIKVELCIFNLFQSGITLLAEPISTIPGYFLTNTQQGITFNC